MAKDTRLVNIYIKIHNKQNLTIEELAYLAEFNPECFKKTCDNLIYNLPESKPLLQPAPEHALAPPAQTESAPAPSVLFGLSPEERQQNALLIKDFLENMRTMETGELTSVQNVDLNQVKDLMGSLYMEMMFPHSGAPGYFQMYDTDQQSTFNAKA